MASQPSLLTSILVTNEQIAGSLEAPFRRIGLTFGAFELLAAVKSGRGFCSQAELARRLGIRPASLCEAVQALASKGWIEQVASESDRRVKMVRLTASGQAVLASAATCINELNSKLEAMIRPTDLRATLSTLERVSQNLEDDITKDS